MISTPFLMLTFIFDTSTMTARTGQPRTRPVFVRTVPRREIVTPLSIAELMVDFRYVPLIRKPFLTIGKIGVGEHGVHPHTGCTLRYYSLAYHSVPTITKNNAKATAYKLVSTMIFLIFWTLEKKHQLPQFRTIEKQFQEKTGKFCRNVQY